VIFICEKIIVSELDVRNNSNLKYLGITSRQSDGFSELDLSNNLELTSLTIEFSNLNYLDVSNNTKLTSIYLRNHNFTEIDISKNLQLKTLYLDNGFLTEIKCDVDYHQENLSMLNCRNNKLKFSTLTLKPLSETSL